MKKSVLVDLVVRGSSMKTKLTHGEKWYSLKESLFKKNKLYHHSTVDKSIPNRMGYKEALAYYKNKISDYFDSKLTVSDFDSVEDYYGYFEAKKLLRAR